MTLIAFTGFEDKSPNGRPGAQLLNNPEYSAGRNGGTCFTGDGAACRVPIPSTSREFTMSAAVRRNNNSGVNGLISLDASMGSVNMSGPGGLGLSADDFPGQSIQYFMPINEWVRLEYQVKMTGRVNNQDVAGYQELWINGISMGRTVGKSGYWDRTPAAVNFNCSGRVVSFDDIYVTDTVGAAPYNGRLGDIRVEAIVPTGNGSSNQGVGTDGDSVDNYLLVDEIPASSSDNVLISNPGERDLYVMSDPTLVGTVLAVQPHYHAAKTDAGAATLKSVVKVGANETVGAALGLGVTPGYVSGPILTTAPDSTAWTTAKVAAIELGFEAAS